MIIVHSVFDRVYVYWRHDIIYYCLLTLCMIVIVAFSGKSLHAPHSTYDYNTILVVINCGQKEDDIMYLHNITVD